MTGTVSRIRRRRRWKLLVPAFFVLYLAMIPLNGVIEDDHSEVFPFFRWKLFANVPDWQTTEFGLVIDAIDGEPAEGGFYLIPSTDIRDWKVLSSTAWACRRGDPCDDTVSDVLVPIVRRALGDRSIDFSIIEAEVDLGDVRDGVDDLADETALRTDFYRPVRVIGRWNTDTGRIEPSAETE